MPSKHAISVSLTEHLDLFVKSELTAGRYRTASEVVRAGLRLLEEQIAERRPSATPSGSVVQKPVNGRNRAARQPRSE
ncbi:type II toxin-antitoxin system ParD family antitoxin [Paraburkholderia sp. HD33-4]|uniref:type II toxin-antitoxin system ParD family antitoxin n=1 Tax=Paraburkholderia sp. HD33-4 TaxID=2883242 RepID=UPI001F426A28|nr:type II toxin-antitoxin system ParD family antitoxin [Paraburkholderia sp. HD33-4]